MKIQIGISPASIKLYNDDGSLIDLPVRSFTLNMEAGQIPTVTITAELWVQDSLEIIGLELDKDGLRLASELG